MSLYNQLFGTNPVAGILLHVVGLNMKEVGRFRDVTLKMDFDRGLQIAVFTRMGGGNRESYSQEINFLQRHKGYVSDYDDEYDGTYATFMFDIPENHAELCENLSKKAGTGQPMEKFKKMLEDLQSGKETPETKKAMDVGAQVMSKIESADPEGSHVIEI